MIDLKRPIRLLTALRRGEPPSPAVTTESGPPTPSSKSVDYIREIEILREAVGDDDGIRGMIAASLTREFEARGIERIIPIIAKRSKSPEHATFE